MTDRTPIHRRADDAVLDAIAAAKEAELNEQLADRELRDTSGIPPWSEASAAWIAAQPTVAERQRELDDLG